MPKQPRSIFSLSSRTAYKIIACDKNLGEDTTNKLPENIGVIEIDGIKSNRRWYCYNKLSVQLKKEPLGLNIGATIQNQVENGWTQIYQFADRKNGIFLKKIPKKRKNGK
ncbi:MAG: hypothetical protein ABH887_01780 [bacterium]